MAIAIEFDAIYHGPEWTPLAPEAFRAQMVAPCAQDAWVADGNYSVVQAIVFARAQLVVWLDYLRSCAVGLSTSTLRALLERC